ncbi:MAG: type 1 glutamine amidotransferase [Peptoanaerobacter stomatis]|uniref:type 1 glutamine amidotransferase n=1 Tax=Peptoanaerobacter stomatis TaxID=796937 RepID=UPI003FA013A8
MELKLLHLYHDIMDLYGDKGNIKTLEYRCKMRNIDFIYDTCSIGEQKDYSSYNLIFMGGGADKEQLMLSQDLQNKREGLEKALKDNVFFLLICGGYQLFGQYYVNANGEKIQGLKFFPYRTEKSQKNDRCIGNIYIDVELGDDKFKVLGFENHGGQTYDADDKYFGKVIFGNGNHYNSKYEGFFYKNVIGTYMHGPLLPKNPNLADFIIKKSLSKDYKELELSALDDSFENMAKQELLYNLGYKEV